jgi:acetyl esterase/lipase
MKLRFPLLAVALAACPLVSRSEVAAPPAGFRALFNGTDLTGWYGLNPHSVEKLEGEKKEASLRKQREAFANHWRVENGELVNDGTGPYATTEEELGDIELQLEYKTVAQADSGVYLRGTPQIQIWDINQPNQPDKPDRNPWKGSGGLYNNPPRTLGRDPLEVQDKPLGQWNSFVIRQIGARTWVTLNGRVVVDGANFAAYPDKTKALPVAGPLMLQTHGGEIRWRNIFVRNISPGEAQKWLAANPPIPEPTLFDVPYGSHRKQVLHFWKAESDRPTPLLLFIHGGGWAKGHRLGGLKAMLPGLLKEGISVVSVGYRFINEAVADGVNPPVDGPLKDAARALQFVRSKAAEWNIDKMRIAASGGSAGACTSLWLAFHNDLADPTSADPIARESTRLICAAVDGAQTTLDPAQMKEWTPNSTYGGHAFGFSGDPGKRITSFSRFLEGREKILPWIAEYSPYALVTPDDPAIYLRYSTPPALGQEEKDPTHTANFGVKLQERLRAVGVPCELSYPGAPDSLHSSSYDYLVEKLKSAAGK